MPGEAQRTLEALRWLNADDRTVPSEQQQADAAADLARALLLSDRQASLPFPRTPSDDKSRARS